MKANIDLFYKLLVEGKIDIEKKLGIRIINISLYNFLQLKLFK